MSVAVRTRLEREQRKKRWDSLNGIMHKYFGSLETWVRDVTQKLLDKLTKLLKTDLSDNEVRWECEAQIDIYATLRETWQKKLDYIRTP